MFRLVFIIAMFTLPVYGAVLHIGESYTIAASEYKTTSPSLAMRDASGNTYYIPLGSDCSGRVNVRMPDGTIFKTCEIQRLKYLESTGMGEYIDTGITIDKNIINKVKIDTEFSGTYSAPWNLPLGIGYPSPNPYCFIGIGHNKITYGYDGDIYTEITLSKEQIETFHTYSIDYRRGEVRFDNNIVHSFQQEEFSGNTGFNIYMFTWNSNEAHLGYQHPVMKIKWARISIDDKLVRDYIPVLDSDGVPAMLDLVSGKFFYNIGSGQFKYSI